MVNNLLAFHPDLEEIRGKMARLRTLSIEKASTWYVNRLIRRLTAIVSEIFSILSASISVLSKSIWGPLIVLVIVSWATETSHIPTEFVTVVGEVVTRMEYLVNAISDAIQAQQSREFWSVMTPAVSSALRTAVDVVARVGAARYFGPAASLMTMVSPELLTRVMSAT